MDRTKIRTRTLADVRAMNAWFRFRRNINRLIAIQDIIIRLQVQHNGKVEFPSIKRLKREYKRGYIIFKINTESNEDTERRKETAATEADMQTL